MKVTLKHLKHLNLDEDTKEFEIKETMTIKDLMNANKIPISKELAVMFVVNGHIKQMDYVLEDGDEVAIVPVFTGG